MTPDSPLATNVQASFRRHAEASDTPRPKDFWKLISTETWPRPNGPKAPSPPVGSTDEKTIPSVILSKIETVVCIKAGEQSNPVQLSGVVVSPDGLILCTAHDLRNLQQVNVICYDGLVVGGNVVHADHRLDLAMVHVEREFEAFIDLADGRNLLGVGERLYSVGCPIDLGGTVYSGVVNAPPRQVEGLPLWQVHMEIHHGSSGSPVFDVQGTIVAVVKGRYRGTDSVGFLIPLETIMTFATHVDP